MTKLCPRGKAAAKRKFKVYPSAYANAYASKICAGKIKDPSGVKRKDFRGPKPAAKGRMIKAATGAALGAISAGGDPRKNHIDNQQAPNFIHFENPYYYRCPWYSSSFEECGDRAIKNLENTIVYEGPNNIAAILLEGESGTSGCIKYPPFYLKKVNNLCKK